MSLRMMAPQREPTSSAIGRAKHFKKQWLSAKRNVQDELKNMTSHLTVVQLMVPKAAL